MPDVKRQVKIVTDQHVIDEDSGVEGFPQRAWSIKILLLDEQGNELGEDANIFDKVTYHLHPSFEKRANQTLKNYPFEIKEKGWGEFDMSITLTAGNKGGDHPVQHDLNFQEEHYEVQRTITFRNPKESLLNLLRKSGPVPGDANGVRAQEGKKKGGKKDKNIDMEKLAEGLQKLVEDDLLQVVQMIHDEKTPDTYTKNDVENGEFQVDLYTLPDSLVKKLWDFTAARTEL